MRAHQHICPDCLRRRECDCGYRESVYERCQACVDRATVLRVDPGDDIRAHAMGVLIEPVSEPVAQ